MTTSSESAVIIGPHKKVRKHFISLHRPLYLLHPFYTRKMRNGCLIFRKIVARFCFKKNERNKKLLEILFAAGREFVLKETQLFFHLFLEARIREQRQSKQ